MSTIEKNTRYPDNERAEYVEGVAAFKRVSWGAIFAGALVAVSTLLLLNLLGAAIGFASINPTTEVHPFEGLGAGTLWWWVISNLIALFAGGWTAGRLAGFPKRTTAALHGFLSWSLYAIVSVWLFTSTVGTIVSGVGNVIGRTASLAGRGIEAALPNTNLRGQEVNNTVDQIMVEARQLLAATGKEELQPENLQGDANELQQEGAQAANRALRHPNQFDAILQQYWNRVVSKGESVVSEVDRQALVNAIVNETDLSRTEARRVADRWITMFENSQEMLQQRAQQVAQRAEEVGGDIADAMAKAATWAFVALLLGAAAAAVGGLIGRQRDLAVIGDSINPMDVNK